jgi:hypothetical protein
MRLKSQIGWCYIRVYICVCVWGGGGFAYNILRSKWAIAGNTHIKIC